MIARRIQSIAFSIPTKAIKSGLRDLVFVGGLGLAAYGIFLIYPPAAIIFAGICMSAVALLGASPDSE